MTGRAETVTIGGEIAATARLAAPLAIANFLQMAVNAVDILFVARLGQEALAAASLGIAYFWLVNYGLFGVVSACAPLMSAQLGRRVNPVRAVRRTLRMAFWLALAGGLVGQAMAMASGPFFRMTGQEPLVAEQAARFLTILALSVFPTLMASALRIFVSVMGRPVFASAITGLAIAVNACANYAFVFGNLGAPRLGLEGSAVASVVTSCITVLAYAAAIAANRRMRRYRVFGRWWRPEWRTLADMVRIGSPIGLMLVAESGLFTGAAFLMGRIGAAELAAHTIALQIASFTFQVAAGVSQAGTIRVALHFGAGDAQGVRRAGRAALLIALCFMSAMAVLLYAFPSAFLGIYVDARDPANAHLLALGVQYLSIAAAFQIFDGTQSVTAGLLRGLQDTRVPMVIAIGGYWLIGFVIAATLGLGTPLGGLGVWAGLATSLVVVALLLVRRWSRLSGDRLVRPLPRLRFF